MLLLADGKPMTTAQAQVATVCAADFYQAVAQLSRTFIDLPVAAVDGKIQEAVAQVAEVIGADRVTLTQVSLDGKSECLTHEWSDDAVSLFPWVAERVVRDRGAVIVSRLDELPPDASRDRQSFQEFSIKSLAVCPLIVGESVVGELSFAALTGEHELPTVVGDGLRQRDWDADTIGRLRLVTQIVGSALARKRADLALRAALEDNERLRKRLEAENVYLRTEVKNTNDDYAEVVGRSPAIRAVLHKVDQVAATDVPVLLLGETGTGKELIARAVHAGSARSARPLIAVNCAALPPSLIESELFGHEKGAFTGATQARAGRFELADGGTLFLDEGKLLRTLQGGEIERLGSSRLHKVDVRVIAATNRDLKAALGEGRFRADLYYRLSVFPIEVPALRDRRDDIPLLVWHFIQSRQRELGRLVKDIPKAAMDALVAYDWPGNVRELQNIIDRALILSTGPTLRIEEALGVGGAVRGARDRAGGGVEELSAAERAHIIGVLDRCGWAIQGRGKAADRLGLRPSTLRNRMRKLDIRRPAQ